MEDEQTVGRRKFLTMLGLAPTAPLLTHIKPGDIAAQTSGGRRRSADLSGIWFDIRDYGDISSGTITTALQATITAIGAAGKCKTIMIPQVSGVSTMTQGAITIPAPSGDPGWTFIYACKRIQITSTMAIPSATTIKGDFGTGVRGIGIGAMGPGGAHMVGDSISAGSAVIYMDHSAGSCLIENLTIECGGGASYGIEFYRSSGLIIRNCNVTGCTNTSGGHAAYVGLQPGLLIDGSFWIQTYDCKFAAGDNASPSVWDRSSDPTSDVGVGLLTMYNTVLAQGGIKLGPAQYGPNAGNCHFDNVVCENLHSGGSLLEIDATGNTWNDVSLNQAEVADSGTFHIYKVTGSPSNVKFYNCGNVSIDPASTGATSGLYVFGGVSGGTGGDTLDIFPSYNPNYGRMWPDMLDTRLVATPRAPQWTIGTVINVNQDGTGWINKSAGATITTAGTILAPDGTLNAVQLSGGAHDDHIDIVNTSRNLSIGDWYVAGCWVQCVNPANSIGSNQPIRMQFLYGSNTSGTQGGDSNMYHGDAGFSDGAWKWCCGAYKILTLGSGGNPCGAIMTARCNEFAFNYFNPCIQYIPTSLGFTDGDVMNYARSLKGGWAPQATLSGAGQLSILDHQSLRGGLLVPALTFGTLPSSPIAGMQRYITDCNTVVWGANAVGGGTNKVMVWYNGTDWTVMGK